MFLPMQFLLWAVLAITTLWYVIFFFKNLLHPSGKMGIKTRKIAFVYLLLSLIIGVFIAPSIAVVIMENTDDTSHAKVAQIPKLEIHKKPAVAKGIPTTAKPVKSTPTIITAVENTEIHDSPSKTQLVLSMIIESDIQKVTPENLKQSLMAQYDNKASWYDPMLQERDKPNRQHFTHLFINMYDSKESSKSMSAWIARLEWIESQNKKPSIEVREDTLNELKTGGEKVFGLTLAERKAIYIETCKSNNEANAKADAEYKTDNEDWFNYAQKLKAKYRKKIAKKHDLTPEQVKEIGLEGATKFWPKK